MTGRSEVCTGSVISSVQRSKHREATMHRHRPSATFSHIKKASAAVKLIRAISLEFFGATCTMFCRRVLENALPELGRKLNGFDAPDAVLTAPETRSSSPVRILRDERRQSQIRGLYPCGEGAGYAGGITSAAVDGMKCAEAVIESL